MRRIDYKDEEYLIHTRSGERVAQSMRESGINVTCNCNGVDQSDEGCIVKWPKDTAFLLTNPTELEQKILGDRLSKGYRLACEAMFK